MQADHRRIGWARALVDFQNKFLGRRSLGSRKTGMEANATGSKLKISPATKPTPRAITRHF